MVTVALSSLLRRIRANYGAKTLRKMSCQRTVIALDFDHTVVDDNTDIVARNLLEPSQIPEHVRKLYKGTDWIGYMQEIFNLLHENQFTQDAILNSIRGIPETPGFCEFIRRMAERPDVDVIIISDSNSVFINTWLEAQRLSPLIKQIFTNPAFFPETGGPLTIAPYHHQTECSLSSVNLCKGKVLCDYLAQTNLYSQCIYIGDGRNDLCPILRLSVKDLACARVGYSCAKLLQGEYANQVKAPVFLWETGFELLYKATCQLKMVEQE